MRTVALQALVAFVSRPRFFTMRATVVAIPLGLLAIMSGQLDASTAADQIGLLIFRTGIYPIIAAALLVTPGILVPVFVEERRNNKLEVLCSTPLTLRQILFGKWLARSAMVALVCVAALPLPFSGILYGGVAVRSIGDASLVVFLTVLWTSALGLYAGTRRADMGHAMRDAYLAVVAVVLGGFLLLGFGAGGAGGAGLARVARALAFCNPFIALGFVDPSLGGSPPTFWTTSSPIAVYATWSVLAACLGLWRAHAALGRAVSGGGAGSGKPAAAAAAADPSGTVIRVTGRYGRREALRDRNPALWLEVLGARGPRRWGSLAILTGIGLAVIVELFFVYLMQETRGRDRWPAHLVPMLSYLFAAFFAVATTGAATFHRENVANTLDVLHSTPLGSQTLARAKVVGVLLAGRTWWLASVGHGVFAVLLGDHHPIAFLGYLVTSATLVVALAAFAMTQGLIARTMTAATARTLLAFVAHVVVLPVFLGFLVALARHSDEGLGLLLGWHPGWLAVMPYALTQNSGPEIDVWAFSLLYMLIYLIFAIVVVGNGIPTRYARRRDDEAV